MIWSIKIKTLRYAAIAVSVKLSKTKQIFGINYKIFNKRPQD